MVGRRSRMTDLPAMYEVVLNGTNFRHAVEFSRSGCARFGPFRPPWGNPIYATRSISRSQILRSAFRAPPAPGQHFMLLIVREFVTLTRLPPR